ncbi:hypothetical protein [Blastopirellula marina]|uniref:DUF2383 domain-containing protein n=1 Tax=Blastopirellula marina TaxID=124 RepID=A0A2S8G984_9BACT|nr:hypothetical protein [Blastopirellula marina]PQO40664.1 hypothetical protein C5Y98_05425 [Blastopirellula marina]PTL45624.1 hypothetical protein C5Y97_05425 [Blastopirellula marina]
MDAPQTPKPNHRMILAEIVEGLREYQQILVDSAGKVSNTDIAMRLYHVAGEHGKLETQLRQFAQGELADDTPLATPFLNQIRALGQRLREFGDLSRSRYVMCEIIQTEERMIRRFRALIDQVTDTAWRKRLTTYLFRMLEVRESISRLRNVQTNEYKRGPTQRPSGNTAGSTNRLN